MPTADTRIRALTVEFVAQLSVVIQEAALDAVRGALDGAPAPRGPRRGRRKATWKKAANGRRKKGRRKAEGATQRKAAQKKAGRRGKRVRRSSGDVEATASAILAHVRANPGSSVGDVGEALGLTTKGLALPIKKLIAGEKLRTEGERRGTRYFAGSGGGRKTPTRKKQAARNSGRKTGSKTSLRA